MSLSPQVRQAIAIRQMIMLSRYITNGDHPVAHNDNPANDLPVPA